VPIPSPNRGESQKAYISRVMPMLSKEHTDNPKQAVAIAYSEYRRHKSKMRSAKAGRRKARKMFVKKSAAEETSKLLLAGVSLICGTTNQGEVFYDRSNQTARVVLRSDRTPGYFDEWKSKVAEVLGINDSRVSVSPSAPREWGTGSQLVRVLPDGSVEIDPGLEAVEEPEPLDTQQELPTEESAAATVEQPATPAKIAARFEAYEPLCKIEDEPDFTFILGPVLTPEKADRQGDIISVEEIEKAAHSYVQNCQAAGVLHKVRLKKRDAVLVESYTVRSPNYEINGVPIEVGSWVVGFRIYEPQIRASIKNGTFRGFSIHGDSWTRPIA
jgi:Putative phage serine protease XkdF